MHKQITHLLLMMAVMLTLSGTSASALPVTLMPPSVPVMVTPATDSAKPDSTLLEPRAMVPFDQLKPVFAIANASGDQLITFTPVDNIVSLDSMDAAIGANGQYLPIVFREERHGDGQDTGRITAANFEHMDGAVYDVPQKNATPDETYLLTNRLVLPETSLLVSSLPQTKKLTAEITTAVGNAKQRAVQQAWTLAKYGDKGDLHLAVFEPEGNHYLLSIILESAPGVYKSIDYAAESDGSSVWRVDDMGTVDPAHFIIRCAVETDQGLVFIISWVGAEGENTFFLLEKRDSLEEQPNTAYRYWSS